MKKLYLLIGVIIVLGGIFFFYSHSELKTKTKNKIIEKIIPLEQRQIPFESIPSYTLATETYSNGPWIEYKHIIQDKECMAKGYYGEDYGYSHKCIDWQLTYEYRICTRYEAWDIVPAGNNLYSEELRYSISYYHNGQKSQIHTKNLDWYYNENGELEKVCETIYDDVAGGKANCRAYNKKTKNWEDQFVEWIS